ncbi:hypothetical protein SAMN05216353_10530 [Halobacillus alkaliphilus]|uniref:Gas vesicle protein GvpU n=1 Tax=Halobacillus alkaliphilus TaxID=396056 RepID=A0A1I2KLG8_9BACI|nr:gas vesicle accessory protein GvpU [Halobacillus alkaliphilus]SFF67178.1 hypothetical protein SAMN05216353_10530 [Halobacillus alkaliphilus]
MDDLLMTYVKAANQHGFSLDITLNINGALVTGTTVSAQKYLDSASQSFEGGNDVSKQISEKLSEASQNAEDQNQEDVSYIHLKNAQVYNGDSSPTPAEGQFFWRGRMDQVDGFFLGRIASE